MPRALLSDGKGKHCKKTIGKKAAVPGLYPFTYGIYLTTNCKIIDMLLILFFLDYNLFSCF